MNPKGSKHIEMSYHLVRDYIEHKDVDVVFLPTALMVADIFTKSLPKPIFDKHAAVLNGGQDFEALMKMRGAPKDRLGLTERKLYRITTINGTKESSLATI